MEKLRLKCVTRTRVKISVSFRLQKIENRAIRITKIFIRWRKTSVSAEKERCELYGCCFANARESASAFSCYQSLVQVDIGSSTNECAVKRDSSSAVSTMITKCGDSCCRASDDGGNLCEYHVGYSRSFERDRPVWRV